MHTYIHTYTDIFHIFHILHLHIRMNVHIHVHAHIHLHVHIHIDIHTYVRIAHIHAHMHTSMHAYVCACLYASIHAAVAWQILHDALRSLSSLRQACAGFWTFMHDFPTSHLVRRNVRFSARTFEAEATKN